MDDSNSLVLMDAQRIERSLKRIAHQISEDNKVAKDIVVLGINERGYAVAEVLKEYLLNLSGIQVSCHQILLEGDDTAKGVPPLQNKYVLLVDDVIFSGTTMFQALQVISQEEAPGEVHTVTLVDRGHRKLPVFAQFVGMELPTKLNEHVTVEIKNQVPNQVILAQAMH